MGMLNDSVAKAHERQRQGLVAEATRAGCKVVGIEQSGDAGRAAGSAIGSGLKGIFGGTLRADTVQVLRLESGGASHVYVQPYSGLTPMPGEHHTLLQGTLPAAAALTPGGWNPEWKVPADKELANRLNKSTPALKAVAKKCEFQWPNGLAKIELEWAVQVASFGDGSSHVVMQAGRYGGFTTYEVGFGVFLALRQQLAAILQPEARPHQLHVFPVSSEAIFKACLLGETAPAAGDGGPPPLPDAAAATPGAAAADFTERIRAAALPFEEDAVHVRSVPEKKARNIRQHVLPPEAKEALLVAVFDQTAFGSAKESVVFTPTHLYARGSGTAVSFRLADLEEVVGMGGGIAGDIEVRVAGKGHVTIPCLGDKKLLQVLQRLAPS